MKNAAGSKHREDVWGAFEMPGGIHLGDGLSKARLTGKGRKHWFLVCCVCRCIHYHTLDSSRFTRLSLAMAIVYCFLSASFRISLLSLWRSFAWGRRCRRRPRRGRRPRRRPHGGRRPRPRRLPQKCVALQWTCLDCQSSIVFVVYQITFFHFRYLLGIGDAHQGQSDSVFMFSVTGSVHDRSTRLRWRPGSPRLQSRTRAPPILKNKY